MPDLCQTYHHHINKYTRKTNIKKVTSQIVNWCTNKAFNYRNHKYTHTNHHLKSLLPQCLSSLVSLSTFFYHHHQHPTNNTLTTECKRTIGSGQTKHFLIICTFHCLFYVPYLDLVVLVCCCFVVVFFCSFCVCVYNRLKKHQSVI